jgi:hypothetical protein
MIFYQILCYHDFNNVKSLVDAMYRKEDFYYITVDAQQVSIFDDLIYHFDGYNNVSIAQTTRVVWGGFSQVAAITSGMRFFIENTTCRWYINLSETCVPLKSAEKIEMILKKYSARDVHSMISLATEGGKMTFLPVPRMMAETLRHADEQQLLLNGRGPVVFDRNNDLLADKPSTNPAAMNAFEWHRRQGVAAAEIPSSRGLTVRPLGNEEVLARRDFFRRVPLRGHSLWMTLGREHVKAFFRADIYSEAVSLFSSTLCPDESFFATVMMYALRGREGEVIGTNLRLHEGVVRMVDLPLVEQMFDDDNEIIFGRKINGNDRTKIFKLICTRARNSRPSPNRFNSDSQFFQISIGVDANFRFCNAPTVETVGGYAKVLSLLQFPWGQRMDECGNEIGWLFTATDSSGSQATRKVRIDAFCQDDETLDQARATVSVRSAYHFDLDEIFPNFAYRNVTITPFAAVRNCEVHWVGRISSAEQGHPGRAETVNVFTRLYELMDECRPFPVANQAIVAGEFDLIGNRVQFHLIPLPFRGEKVLTIEAMYNDKKIQTAAYSVPISWKARLEGAFWIPTSIGGWIGAGLVQLVARLENGAGFVLKPSAMAVEENFYEIEPTAPTPYLVLDLTQPHDPTIIKSGFSFPERGFAWTSGLEAELTLPVPANSRKLKLRVSTVGMHMTDDVQKQQMVFLTGDKFLSSIEFDSFDPKVTTISFPVEDNPAPTIFSLRIQFPDAFPPVSVAGYGDKRVLGFRVRRISVAVDGS